MRDVVRLILDMYAGHPLKEVYYIHPVTGRLMEEE
jgi:hypothetical protein